MQRHLNPASNEVWQSLQSTLRLTGFNPAEFQLHQDIEVKRLGFDMPDQLFWVSRQSTGHKQLYSVAPGSPWIFNAYADLVAGRFGAPRHEVQ